MWALFEQFRFNTVLPDIWIIEEQLRQERERERYRRESIPLELPISLPEREEYPNRRHKKNEVEEERVIIIDLSSL